MYTNHFAYWPERLSRTLTVPETTLFDNLLFTSKQYPEKVAIYYYGQSYTFKKLLQEVEALAGYMEQTCHVAKGDKILLFMQNSPQFLISFFAILRLRAVVVPINPMSITKDLHFYLEDCQISHAIVGMELYEKVLPLKETTSLKNILVTSYASYIHPNHHLEDLPSEVTLPVITLEQDVWWEEALVYNYQASSYHGKSDDLAVIPYTSGTTGLPKGCKHTNRTVQANTVSAYHWMNFTSDTVVLTTLPLYHVTGLVHSALTPIFGGSSMVILTRWDRDVAGKVIETYNCTHWTNISTMLIDFLANPKLSTYDISSLQSIGGGGAPLPEAVGEALFNRTGLRYIEGYGLSETISHTHFNPPHRSKLQCLGIPTFDLDARIIDLHTKEILGPYENGELVVSGPQVFEGYYNRVEENEEAHIQIDGKTFFRTGDIVQMDNEGYYFLVDRLKRMINASGYKVWPTEVESILYNHPAVQQACVVRTPDEKRGETVKAFIIIKETYKGYVTEKEIIEWSKQQMAAYKYPRVIGFIDHFPTTSSGKILWRQLQEQGESSSLNM
ncbi:long-chain-fatty-acid--CoA ligase [Virgibacillus salexigens]|uniref:long-chain-fatty-acid--CoA ligase n=1 Tax=Virgibacillus salexigens TaxID=61016 RepID=UPI003081DEC8